MAAAIAQNKKDQMHEIKEVAKKGARTWASQHRARRLGEYCELVYLEGYWNAGDVSSRQAHEAGSASVLKHTKRWLSYHILLICVQEI